MSGEAATVRGRVRVMRIIARLNIGGPAIHATRLTRDLDPSRYESHLVCGAAGEGEGDYLSLRADHIDRRHDIAALGREIDLRKDRRALGELMRLMRTVRPQIVHTHTAKAGLLGRWAAWRCGVPIIVHTFHGHVFHGYFPPWKTALFVRAEKTMAGLSTRLLTVSDEVRRQILARGIGTEDRFEVIRLGLDLQPFASVAARTGELKRSLGLADGTRLVGIVARLVPIKAHEVFLEVAARLAAARPDVAFAIVGDGERRAELGALAQAMGLTGRVHFLGWRSDLDRIYADLDVVMLTSRNEGSPVALIEAMAAGRPVVATRAGGVAELVGDAGLVTDIDDVDGLVRHVSAVLADPATARALGDKARSRVVPAYTHERLVADIDELYQRLLRERAAGTGPGLPTDV